ncbi:MAG: hypothetical protein GY772_21620 [bacterium]|nr:hypothetical protein [bacterium]
MADDLEESVSSEEDVPVAALAPVSVKKLQQCTDSDLQASLVVASVSLKRVHDEIQRRLGAATGRPMRGDPAIVAPRVAKAKCTARSKGIAALTPPQEAT